MNGNKPRRQGKADHAGVTGPREGGSEGREGRRMKVKLFQEIMTDRPTNRTTDQPTAPDGLTDRVLGSFASKKRLIF